jgi:hypothetical protein
MITPLTPYNCNLPSKNSWLTQLNALVKSQIIPATYSFLFHALKTVSMSLCVAVSVKTPSLKPYCSGTSIL